MHFGWGKLPKIKTRYHGHLFGLRGRVISHRGKRQDGREHSVKLNLMNHSDRQTRTEPTLPRTIFGNLGNGEKHKCLAVANCIYLYRNWKAQMEIRA